MAIPTIKGFRVITDNGSNMIAAFKESAIEIEDDQCKDEQECEVNPITIGDEEAGENSDVDDEEDEHAITEDNEALTEIANYERLDREHNAAFSG